MYERFTDRAGKVMQLSNQEAKRLNSEIIDTEHILLGLVKEGSGVAANVLKNLGIDLQQIRREVEKLVHFEPAKKTGSRLPQTPRAKKVIEYAMEQARDLNHNYVGTEHLLLGLLRVSDGGAAKVFANLDIDVNEVRDQVLNLLSGAKHVERNQVLGEQIARQQRTSVFGCLAVLALLITFLLIVILGD